ncbi:MAG: hypothetical protein Q7W44_09940 [Coriobacteriia bacterium]|nr:hypothetical protein [Coriobacteriia bacterium]
MGTVIRPDMTDEDLGMRLYEVNRQRAVERALERLRHGLRADWYYLTQEDLVSLRWLLGELWAVSTRAEWDELHFSKLDFEHTRQIVSLGDRLRRHGTQRMATIDAVRAIVMGVRELAAGTGQALDGASFAY